MPRFKIEPRDVPTAAAARRLGLTEATFRQHLPSLMRRGFPAPDPTTGHYDLKVIDRWMDERHSTMFAPGAKDASQVALQRIERLRAEGLPKSDRRRGRG